MCTRPRLWASGQLPVDLHMRPPGTVLTPSPPTSRASPAVSPEPRVQSPSPHEGCSPHPPRGSTQTAWAQSTHPVLDQSRRGSHATSPGKRRRGGRPLGGQGMSLPPPMTSSDGKASHTEGTDGDGGWGAPAEDQDQTGTQQSVTDAGPRHPDSRCKIRGPQLTQHVERPNGVGLQRLDGVVHVAGRRGWRRQVVDLVHCGGKTTPVTSTENTERLNS